MNGGLLSNHDHQIVTGKLKKMSDARVGSDGSNSPARSCMFYKLMVASILQDKRLKIPKKFVNKYGEGLSSVAGLTVTCGRIWLVELQKANDRLWFHKGWHEFVECYSIGVGHFLVFIYEGNSNFNVHMFDLNISEMKSPCNILNGLPECSHGNSCLVLHEKDDGLKKLLGSSPPCPTLVSSVGKKFEECIHCNWIQSAYAAAIEKLHIRRDAYNSRGHIRSSRDIGTQFNGSELTGTEDGVSSIISGRGRRSRGSKRMVLETSIRNSEVKLARAKIISETFTRRWRAVTLEEKQRAIRAAHLFNSDNPFFRIILRPSYVYRGFLLHIPSSFARTFLNRVTGFITLQVSDGKQWPVWCSYKDGNTKLSQGWMDFVWENNLEEGDVCIFELIHAKEIVMEVTVFRVLDGAAPANQLPD